ncbi:hypothetical protein DND132_2586 [Pseudodesulfovibrio mercurii]|uniref:Uncharacterized protein n=1 Tax=Pseudodesulfovibrio mercurii TaxID=641491 RepID=F0JDB5_9BACT|nr:hypothetical protein [Pseudodesulfovibrio mercurii]EGB15789.1 hypothetical protein DND132_2586 [Pseudodesulfovibrio mercurii]
MRISSQAAEQYRKTDSLAERRVERKTVQPQARTTTTSFGFRLGKFGVDYREETTVLDPSLSRSVREQERQARAFRAEAEVEDLRAEVGVDGAAYRDRDTSLTDDGPSAGRVKTALAAYARAQAQILPPPGNMLAGVV